MAVFFACAGLPAHADFPGIPNTHPTYQYQIQPDRGQGWQSDIGSALAAYCSTFYSCAKVYFTSTPSCPGTPYSTDQLGPGTAPLCGVDAQDGHISSLGDHTIAQRSTTVTTYGCPGNSANSITDPSSCACSTGYMETTANAAPWTKACVVNAASVYCQGISGTYGGPRVFQTATYGIPSGPSTLCVGGLGPLSDGSSASCAVTGSSYTAAATQDGKNYVWVDTVTYTGSVCSGTESASAATPKDTATAGSPTACTDPASCAPPAGKCPGTVNGVAVWVTCGSTTTRNTTSSTTGTTGTDGTTTTTGTSTTQTTACTNGSCNTTTSTSTTVTAGSSAPVTTTSTSSVTAGQDAYCKDHPTATQCRDLGTWGGSCSAGYTCSGDAAMCAAARGVYEQKCALVDGPGSAAEKQAYAAAAAASGSGLSNTSISISGANFDSSNALGVGAQCVSDLTVTVWGTSQTIAISKVCPWLTTLGSIMLALAWLSAAVIVGKGVTG